MYGVGRQYSGAVVKRVIKELLRPAGIPVLLGEAGTSTPQRQEALPYQCDWEGGAGGGGEKHKKNRNCQEKHGMPEFQQGEEDRKEGKMRMGLKR